MDSTAFYRNFMLLFTVGAIINTRGQGILINPNTPETVTACIGSDKTISCTFHANVTRLKVSWFFGKTRYFNNATKIKLNSSNGSRVSHYNEDKEGNTSHLTIRNVTFSDHGWYFCKVTQDIPRLKHEHSNGTHLLIESPLEETTTNSATTCGTTLADKVPETQSAPLWWLWVAVGVGCALIVAAVIITSVICGRKKEAPVYENTKEASKRHWKEDRSVHQFMPSKGYSNKQMDTLKPHNYECRPKSKQLSPKL